MQEHTTASEMLNALIDIGRIFSSDKPFNRLFSDLMSKVCTVTGAEGGSLYIYDHNSETLKIVVMANGPLGIEKVTESFDALKITGFIEVPTRVNGELNLRTPSVYSYLKKEKVLILSLDDSSEFDFVNTRKFDEANNYKTRNLAVLPLSRQGGESLIGVLQLINCNDEVFAARMQPFVDALAGQMGMMLGNALLVNETQELMSAIIQMVGVAIDEKSPHTAGHCQRVVELTMMMSDELEKDKTTYKNFILNEEERRELRIAALLHDVGKIITPLHILDKQTKLHALDDKIGLLYERMRAWQLSKKLSFLENKLQENGLDNLLKESTLSRQDEGDYQFLEEVNQGKIFVDEDVQKRLDEISNRMIKASTKHTSSKIISKDELYNLKIQRGTLNPEERKIMEDHVSISIRLLSSIPWPLNLKKVVAYAGAHHENMNGTGYPNQLTGNQMELPARILGIADRFEGISAPDRPYRSVKMTLSRAMSIMENMAEEEEIDRELFAFFKEKKLHIKYAKRYLPSELIDME